MAIKLPSHLHRSRSGTLHFRIAIPADLRHYFRTKEIYRSLRTPSVREALHAAQTLSIGIKNAFSQIRQSMPVKKNPPNPLQVDLTVIVDFDELMRPKSVELQTEPHDTPEAMQSALKAIFGSNAAAPLVPPRPQTALLSETVEDFIRAKRAQGRWTPKTEEENRAVYGLFIRVIGDRPISEIDDEVIVGYLETLSKLPPNINKSPAYSGKTIAEIVTLAPSQMAARTINKNIERVSSLFKWAMGKKKYDVARNPAAGMSLDEGSSAKRQPFTTAELVSLFSSEEFITRTFHNSYAYWLMPLALLTGARLGELCQLYLSDFVEHSGVACIDISDEEEGQRVKNQNAKRLVPVHGQLIELGLMRYVEALRKQGQTRLFPELNERRDGFAQAASNWFQRHKKKCGIDGKHTKVFHSFRHTFISALLDDEVAEHAVAQIVGHESNLITGQVYWNARDAAKRKPTVEKYQPPQEVSRLIPKFEEITITKRRGPEGK